MHNLYWIVTLDSDTAKNLISVLCTVNLHKLTSEYVKKQRIKKLTTYSINGHKFFVILNI